RLHMKGHDVARAVAAHHQPRPCDLRKAPPYLGDLFGVDEHALDLGALVGATHPAPDAPVGAPARARLVDEGRKVAGAETDERVGGIEAGDDDLADLACRDRLAGARTYDLHDQVFVHDHAGIRPASGTFGLIGDDAEFRCGIALED